MKIEYLIREEDLLETQLLIASRSKKLRRQRWTVSISTIVLIAVFCLHPDIRLQSFDLFRIILAIVISLFGGGILFFLIPCIYRRHYSNWIKTHFAGMIGTPVELQITTDSIITIDKTGETKMKLTAIKKVSETDNLFIIQSDNDNYLTIAKQDIDSVKFRDCLISHRLNMERNNVIL
jgi:hypothetical protein